MSSTFPLRQRPKIGSILEGRVKRGVEFICRQKDGKTFRLVLRRNKRFEDLKKRMVFGKQCSQENFRENIYLLTTGRNNLK